MMHHWIAEQWFAFLVDCTLKVSATIVAAFGVTFALRNRSAAARHLVWAAALLSAALLPLCSLLVPSWHSTFAIPMSALLTTPPSVTLPAGQDTTSIVEAATQAESVFTSEKLMVLIWLFGCGIGVAVLTAGSARLIWIAYRANPVQSSHWQSTADELSRVLKLKRSVRFRQSRTAAMLVTWGAARPEVLLPPNAENWSGERVRVVLAHELAHIRRYDWLVQMFAETVRALCWFNPLLWMACDRLRQESECACDDAVLSLGIDGTDYAAELLELARLLKPSNRVWSPSVAMARPSTLERRFAAMLNPTIDRRSITRKTVLGTFVVSLCLVLPLAAMRAPIQSGPGSLSGRIYDPQGTPIQNAVVIAVDPSTRKTFMTASNALGVFQFTRIPAGQYEIRTAATGFLPFQAHAVPIEADQDVNLNIVTLATAPATELSSGLRAVGPRGGGSGTAAPSIQGAGSVPPPPSRIRVGGAVEAANLIAKVQPPYPASAKAARIQGVVILEAIIGTDGVPSSMQVISKDSDPDLVQAAVDAVQQWRYKPTLLNGQPVEVTTTITVNFSLGESSSAAANARAAATALVPPAPPANLQTTPEAAAGAASAPQRIRQGGNVASSNLIDKVQPPYPPEARQARVQGTVILEAVIGTDGTVQDLKVVSGHPLLAPAAIDAVKQWRYKPTLLNGQPVEVVTTVTVNFTLGQ